MDLNLEARRSCGRHKLAYFLDQHFIPVISIKGSHILHWSAPLSFSKTLYLFIFVYFMPDIGFNWNNQYMKQFKRYFLASINFDYSTQKDCRQQLYGHLPPITKTIQVRRTRHAGHCWGSRDELINDIFQWTPAYGLAKAGRPARTYIQQLWEDMGCNPEDLLKAMNDREKRQERVRDIRASGTTWWWWNDLSFYVFLQNLLISTQHTQITIIILMWRSRWTPSYVRAKAGRPAWAFIQQLRADTGYSPEELPEAMDDREGLRERVSDICADGATWRWWVFQ